MQEYITKSEETIDLICHRHYGKERGIVEVVLNANPGLCEHKGFVPEGTTIILPDLETNMQTTEIVRIWS